MSKVSENWTSSEVKPKLLWDIVSEIIAPKKCLTSDPLESSKLLTTFIIQNIFGCDQWNFTKKQKNSKVEFGFTFTFVNSWQATAKKKLFIVGKLQSSIQSTGTFHFVSFHLPFIQLAIFHLLTCIKRIYFLVKKKCALYSFRLAKCNYRFLSSLNNL